MQSKNSLNRLNFKQTHANIRKRMMPVIINRLGINIAMQANSHTLVRCLYTVYFGYNLSFSFTSMLFEIISHGKQRLQRDLYTASSFPPMILRMYKERFPKASWDFVFSRGLFRFILQQVECVS